VTELAIILDVSAPQRRRIEVALEADVGPGDDTFFAPAWTPGSYLIREYVRHLRGLAATDIGSGAELAVEPVAKNRFRVPSARRRRVRITYSVYAHELTVRTSDVDGDHAYWNGACVLLWPVDRTDERAALSVRLPRDWAFVTQIPHRRDGDVVHLESANLDELIDAPCLAAPHLETVDFDVLGKPHRFWFHGLGPVAVPEHLASDAAKIIEAAAAVFDVGLPYERYDFLSLHTDVGGGGLEHTDSSTLLAPRTTFVAGKPYRGFMGLVAHEHFHVWNVKRMRPAELWSFDYETELYTELLWIAEGFTAYYDDHLCLRAGVHDPASYLGVVANSLNALASNVGRFHLSLGRSSRDAWVRLYRPDEDTRNSSQNYYSNGALAAMVLDLTIRAASEGRRSLDDVMRHLWRGTWQNGRGYERADIEEALAHAAGRPLSELLARLVDGPFDPDCETLLAGHGVESTREGEGKPRFGVAFRAETMVLASVVDESPAWHAGLAPGDEILAIGGLRVSNLVDWQKTVDAIAQADRPLEVLLSRRGRVQEFAITPDRDPGSIHLRLASDPDDTAAALRRAWLGA